MQRFNILRHENQQTAIAAIHALAMYDSSYMDKPYNLIAEQIANSVLHDQYALITMEYTDSQNRVQQSPVGYVLWGMLNPIALTTFMKEIRPLSFQETKSGELCALIQFSTPFGMAAEIFKFCREEVPALREHKPISNLTPEKLSGVYDLLQLKTKKSGG